MNRATRFLVQAVGLLAVTAVAADLSAAKSWPLFRGNPQSTGLAAGTLPDQMTELWRFEIKNGAFEGTAAIVDGGVYLGDLDGAVRAIDLSTGKLRWEKKFDTGFMSSPAELRYWIPS